MRLSTFALGDMEAVYTRSGEVVGFELVPRGLVSSDGGGRPEPLVQVAYRGDAASGGFAAGHTLRGGATLDRLRYVDQRVERQGPVLTVTTVVEGDGVAFHHVLRHHRDHRGVQVRTEVYHRGPNPVVLELLSSFTLGGLSPLEGGKAPRSLVLHRIRSAWSAEGRVVSDPIEDLQLEPSWAGHGVRVERFGQVGSLPVRQYFPFVAVEDARHGVVWAAQLACASSWQIEATRRGDALALSGGLADFEMGHWAKALAPGDDFVTPWAFLTVAAGSVDQVAQRLLDLYPTLPEAPPGIPLVFNEFCSSWGRPSASKLQAQLGALKGRGLDVFVIDAGWYADPETGWEQSHGDWKVADHLFPDGLAPAAQAIRQAGLRPGLWFEVETCGPRSRAFRKADHLLTRHGVPITSGQRRFWDLTDPWVEAYLAETVIGRLKADGFGYLKVDYNESLGIGCDGAESLGEGLRQRIAATQEFLARIRREVPGIWIENCASGGHRLEASMVSLTDFSSFSDAHECLEIPVIAANLHRLIPPRQAQIWAVLRAADTPRRLVYSLAATFLGVPCLSGEVEELTEAQWALVEAALRFHRRIAPLLIDGTTTFHGPRQDSYRDLRGWQAIVREGSQVDEALVVVHTFGNPVPPVVEVPLPWEGEVVDTYGGTSEAVSAGGRVLRVAIPHPFEAVAVLLARRPGAGNEGNP